MAIVVNRARPSLWRWSASPSAHPPTEWLHDPPGVLGVLVDSLGVAIVDSKYWKLNGAGDDVVAMTPAERVAEDARLDGIKLASSKETAKSLFDDARSAETVLFRALVRLVRLELNELRALHGLQERTVGDVRAALRTRIDGET